MKSLQKCIHENVPMEAQVLQEIAARFQSQTLNKGDYWLHSGQLCREMAFIRSGYLRLYDWGGDKEVTLWIGGAGSFITSLSSFVFETPNPWNIQAETDCEIEVISRKDHLDLLKRFPEWLEFDNLLLARAYSLLEGSMFAQLHTSANERFQKLMHEQPALFNHVPLQHIASMLGMTPETLSRLRKKLGETTS